MITIHALPAQSNVDKPKKRPIAMRYAACVFAITANKNTIDFGGRK